MLLGCIFGVKFIIMQLKHVRDIFLFISQISYDNIVQYNIKSF